MFNNITPSTKLLFVLDISHRLFHVILTKKNPHEMYYYPNFMNEELRLGKMKEVVQGHQAIKDADQEFELEDGIMSLRVWDYSCSFFLERVSLRLEWDRKKEKN